MNIEHWDDELDIFDSDVIPGDGQESIVTLWQSKKDNVVFKVGNGYERKEDDDGYGNKIYVIQKVKNGKRKK